LVGLMAGMLWD